jgi:hypothetical protein
MMPPQADWPATPGKRWGKPLTHFVLKLVCRYHVIGRENIPIEPPYIIISNHMSYWDIPVINTPPKHPRPNVYARFGKPFRLPEGRAKGDQLDAYTERIMCAIAALLPEQYHGVYAGNPLIEEMRQIVS